MQFVVSFGVDLTPSAGKTSQWRYRILMSAPSRSSLRCTLMLDSGTPRSMKASRRSRGTGSAASMSIERCSCPAKTAAMAARRFVSWHRLHVDVDAVRSGASHIETVDLLQLGKLQVELGPALRPFLPALHSADDRASHGCYVSPDDVANDHIVQGIMMRTATDCGDSSG